MRIVISWSSMNRWYVIIIMDNTKYGYVIFINPAHKFRCWSLCQVNMQLVVTEREDHFDEVITGCVLHVQISQSSIGGELRAGRFLAGRLHLTVPHRGSFVKFSVSTMYGPRVWWHGNNMGPASTWTYHDGRHMSLEQWQPYRCFVTVECDGTDSKLYDIDTSYGTYSITYYSWSCKHENLFRISIEHCSEIKLMATEHNYSVYCA